MKISLTRGAGNGVDRACLMTASNMLIGRGQDGDENYCVCPLLRDFIIFTNDAIPRDLLGELYGPLVWEILGTRNDDSRVMRQRVFAFADWSVRDVSSIECQPITNTQTAKQAICDIAAYVDDYSNCVAACFAAGACASACVAANCYSVSAARSVATRVSSTVCIAATYCHVDAESVWRKCPEIIRRVAEIGDKRPVECVLDCQQLAESLSGA